jgi:beta-lactamase regulating signal transducer with metallopeptidase domain
MKDHIKKLLTKAELQKEDVSEIVLVGSAARIPKIQELLKELCDGQVLTSTNNQMISYRKSIFNLNLVIRLLDLGAAIKEKKDKSVSKVRFWGILV